MTAATVMGQIRSAMRGYLLLDDDPGTILSLLDGFLAQQPTERLATAVLNVDSGEAVIASAGHPPPLVGNLQAALRFPTLLPGPPLGVGDAHYGSSVASLAPLDVLCFYTDGLIELGRSGEANRMQTLANTVSSNASASGDHIAAAIMHALADREKPADDAALLVAKWRGSPGHA
jgi:serine phosphatase RsbU (regulator of sigma subunit)